MSDQSDAIDTIVTISESEDNAPKVESCELSNKQLETYDLDEATKALVIECCTQNTENICHEVPEMTLKEMGFTEPPEGVSFDMGYDKNDLAEAITKLVHERQGTEIEVHIGDRVFDCHMTILQIYGEYFKQFTCMDPIRINSDDVSAVGFEKIYEWMINEDDTPQRKDIVEMYMAARYLNIPDLIKQLWCRFDNRDLLNEERAFKVYLEALPYDIPMLHDLMISRIQLFFLLAVTTEEYLDLKPKHVHQLLSASNVCVNSEMEIYMCGMRWLMHDWQQRKEHAVLIMEAVRFNLMPSWYTTSLKAKHMDKEQHELRNIPEILNMINLGLSYAVTSTFMDKHSPLAEPLHMQHPLPRQWIIDEMASHHHVYQCPNWIYLDFELFNEFLGRIITEGIPYMNRLKYATNETMMSCCRNALTVEAKEVEGILITPSPSADLMAKSMPKAMTPPPSTE